jgi:hypothetical protein
MTQLSSKKVINHKMLKNLKTKNEKNEKKTWLNPYVFNWVFKIRY